MTAVLLMKLNGLSSLWGGFLGWDLCVVVVSDCGLYAQSPLLNGSRPCLLRFFQDRAA